MGIANLPVEILEIKLAWLPMSLTLIDQFDEILDDQDPRIASRYFRIIPGCIGLGSILLVGVVHDHPSSEYRVHRTVRATKPMFLGLELPPLSIPLFELFANDQETPPQFGGEMSIAIQGSEATPVGIDSPSLPYLWLVLKHLIKHPPHEDPSRILLRDLVSATGHTLLTGLGAVFGQVTPFRPRLYHPIRYDCSLFDSPDEQASHERRHIEKRYTLLSAIKEPEAIATIDRLRENVMIDRLRAMRLRGDVIGVIGLEHLEPIYEGLTADD